MKSSFQWLSLLQEFKAAIKREKSDACISFSEREQARPKVKGSKVQEFKGSKVQGFKPSLAQHSPNKLDSDLVSL